MKLAKFKKGQVLKFRDTEVDAPNLSYFYEEILGTYRDTVVTRSLYMDDYNGKNYNKKEHLLNARNLIGLDIYKTFKNFITKVENEAKESY